MMIMMVKLSWQDHVYKTFTVVKLSWQDHVYETFTVVKLSWQDHVYETFTIIAKQLKIENCSEDSVIHV